MSILSDNTVLDMPEIHDNKQPAQQQPAQHPVERLLQRFHKGLIKMCNNPLLIVNMIAIIYYISLGSYAVSIVSCSKNCIPKDVICGNSAKPFVPIPIVYTLIP